MPKRRDGVVSDDQPDGDDLPPLELRDGPARVITTTRDLDRYATQVALGSGPVALDAERASGYRYSQRAYLVQVRREGAGTALIDPIALPDLTTLNQAIGDAEWILHAATQDLACLAEVNLMPTRLFDTEVAGRLLGRDRVSLAALVASELKASLAKGHGATDWSMRPLTTAQLTYAALDVEPLVALRDILRADLENSGRWPAAEQEFAHLLGFRPRDRGPEPWRRLSGMHKLRKPRQWAIARELWIARDGLARHRDVAAGRLIPDAAIIAAVLGDPSGKAELIALSGFHGRGAARYLDTWWGAILRGRELPDTQLPDRNPRPEGPPPPRTWADKNPQAAARLASAKAGIATIAEQWGIAAELLLTPETVRRLCWEPPVPQTADAVAAALARSGARPWQIEATLTTLTNALATEVTSE